VEVPYRSRIGSPSGVGKERDRSNGRRPPGYAI
jgi:hypothetical protein